MDLSDFTDDDDEDDTVGPHGESKTERHEQDRYTGETDLSDRTDHGETPGTGASLELYCQNRPKCRYGVASQTPTAGYSFPSRCPQCDGDLIRADEYDGPEP